MFVGEGRVNLQRSLMVFLLSVACFLFKVPVDAYSAEVDVFTNLGLNGAQVYDIAFDRINPDKVFTGAFYGDGLYRSDDGGIIWKGVTTNVTMPGEDEFKNTAVYAVKISPSDPQVIWVAHNYWMEKSTDGGVTWTHFLNKTIMPKPADPTTGEFRFCRSAAVDWADSQTVYVGASGVSGSSTNGAIFKTIDGGTTWAKMNGGVNLDYTVQDISIDPQDRNTIYAITRGAGGSLYQSKNAGNTWTKIFALPSGTQFFSVAVKPDDSNTIITGSGSGLRMHIYSAGTNTWTTTVPQSAQGSTFVRDISFDPQNSNTLYAPWEASPGIYKVGRSIDGGTNWEVYDTPYRFITLVVHPTNREVVLGGDFYNGVFKSQDHGQTWVPSGNGINSVQVNDFAVDPNDATRMIAATSAGLYKKEGSGIWSQKTASNTNSLRFHPTNTQVFYAGIARYLAKTADNGLTWTYSNQLSTNSLHYVSSIAIDTSNTTTLTLFVSYNATMGTTPSPGGVFKSTDGGTTLVRTPLNGVNLAGQNYPFNTVVIDPSNNQHIFAGGGSFTSPQVLGDLWESLDGGTTWSRTSLQNKIINAILINPDNPNIIYVGAGFSGGMTITQDDATLYKSTDGGVTWTAATAGLPASPPWNSVTDLDFSRQSKDFVYASTLSQGIFASNQAKQWYLLGKPKYDVNAIVSASLYGATPGGVLQLTGTGVIAGRVLDSISGQPLSGATVFTDLGTISTSVDGEFIMISPAGTCAVTAVATDHANITLQDSVTVTGGNVAWVEIAMQSGVPDTSIGPQQNIVLNTGGGKYCFIATAAYGSPMAKQVDILRRFRDAYLLTNSIGRTFVDLYYRNAEPIAQYIESHPRLKPFVRVLLYPLIGMAWLMLSTTILVKGIALLIVLMAIVVLFKMRKRTAHVIVLILCIMPLLVHDVHAATLFQQVGVASSPNPVGSGARAVGMGGAFIAIADDATAASWNPAGLIQLEKPELSIVEGYYVRKERYSSDLHPELNNQTTARDLNLNYFSATVPFKFGRNMVISVNYQRLYEFKRSLDYVYDFSSAGLNLVQEKRYNQKGNIGAAGLAYAVQFTPGLSVGATVNIWTEQLFWKNGWDESFTEHGTGTQGGAPVTIDTTITDKYSGFRGVNANLGVLWNVSESVTAGAVVKTPFKASLHHEFGFTTTSTLGAPANTTVSSQQNITEEITLRMPLSYGFGLAFRKSDALSFALDIYRTEWSKYILRDALGNEFSPINGKPKDISYIADTKQVRVGVEYLFIGSTIVVPVRGGLLYDPEPAQGKMKDVYGISLGSGIAYQGVIFDAAYQMRWRHNANGGNIISTSQVDIDQHLLLASMIYHF